MPRYRVTYEVDAVENCPNYPPDIREQGGYLKVKPGIVHSYPNGATVEEMTPEFKPGWYRHKNSTGYYWLQKATSMASQPDDVYYYTHLNSRDHTMTRIGTASWNTRHMEWVRLKFVDDED